MKTPNLFLLIFTFTTGVLHAQGTFVYDQQSSTDETYPSLGTFIQYYGSSGQSFTPSLSTVGFVRFRAFDYIPGNALGATLVVNLRSNSISGPILGTTLPVDMPDGFAGSFTFYFTHAVGVVPSTTYFFEAIVQSGDNWGLTTRDLARGDLDYLGGVLYGGSIPFNANDLWFREGIVVPEPTSASLILIGSMALGFVARRKNTNR